MALPLPVGLTPAEIAFLCEMESVGVLPRQKLEGMSLLGGTTPALQPPRPANLPLWLALLLKRQRRADIMPPPWLRASSLSAILDRETGSEDSFTPTAPLELRHRASTSTSTHANANTNPMRRVATTAHHDDTAQLPYNWLEMSQILLAAAPEDIQDAETVRRLLRDLREVRAAKVRRVVASTRVGPGAGVEMSGIGAVEVAEARGFVTGVVDGLRKIGASREVAEKERLEEEGQGGGRDESDDDEDMIP